MLKNKLLGLTLASLALAAATSGHAQPYSNAVMNLNPVAYWPLTETAQPPTPVSFVATNSGTAGMAGNGYYGAWYQASGGSFYITNNIVPTNGVTSDGSQALWCQSVYNTSYPGQYVVIPRNTNGVPNPAVTLTPPFSIEVWAYVGSTNGANRTLVSEGQVPVQIGGPNAQDPYYGGPSQGWAGFALGQYQDYFYFSCFATNAVGNKSSELDSSGYNKFQGARVGQWVYVVATFDGTTEQLWTNGVMANSKSLGANGAGLRYVPDPTTPLMIGDGNEVSASSGMNPFSGALDEVAIYPYVLTNQIQAHYAAVSGAYASTVLADSPSLYYRFDDNVSAANSGYPSGTFPVAKNYGSIGAVANGVYQPGTTPGVAGPSYSGFGPNSAAVAINGFFGAVDVGGGALPAELNPTGIAPLTVVSWFKSAPADSPARFQEILGHGDSSYRLAMDQTAGGNRFNPGPGPELQFANAADLITNGWALNDGQWHMAAGVSDGTNDFLYLDGTLVKSGTYGTNITILGSTNDLLLGGDDQYTYAAGSSANTIRNFDGSVAQVAFWTNALSAADIAQLYGAAGVPPTISIEPQPETSNAGTSLSLSVTVRGSGPFDYQWYQNGSAVPGATSSTLTFNPLTAAEAGSYFVVVTNSSGAATSSVAQVTVYSTPVITAQTPTSLQIFRGSTPTLHVSAVGPGLTYQWTLNNSPIPQATLSSYTLPAVQNNGTYGCNVVNTYGTTPISPISLTVVARPTVPYPATIVSDSPMAYFRLDEASGDVAYDYVGGLNGTYTNVYLGQPGYSVNDPNETSANFGNAAPTNSLVGWVPPYLNFGAAAGTNSAFSIEAWVNGGFGPQTSDAGIVALGYGNGGEQFDIDCGGRDPAHDYRFIVRNAAGTAVVLNGTNAPVDGNWHHVVAVCDQPNSNIALYVDGVIQGKTAIGATAGILSSTIPLSIGSRESAFGSQYDNQFNGYINDVSIYNYALTEAQVQAHYYASGVAPVITMAPTNATANFGSDAYFYSSASGTPPLSYQWYDDTTGNPTPVANQTNSTLVISNVGSLDNNRYFMLTVTNAYGQASSQLASLTVLSGPPQLISDISPLFAVGYAGTPFTYTFEVNGSAPLSYVWTLNGNPIPNATNASYSFNSTVGTNLYAVTVHNSSGSLSSSTATNIGIAVPTLNPSDYTYKMKITFAGYTKSETLLDFPALVQLGTNLPGFSFSQFASPTAGDLRFTDASGTREIPHEVDELNPSGVSSFWVQVPTLSSNTNYIWAYWGNPGLTTPETWTTNGGVWVPAFNSAPAYQEVYHLKEGAFPFADATTLHDSTNGVAPTATPGIVGTGALFNGSAWLDAGTNDVGSAFTLSAWVNVDSAPPQIETIWANQHGGYGAPGFALFVNTYNAANNILDLASGNGNGGGNETQAPGAVGFNAWHLVEASVNLTNGFSSFYVDGVDILDGTSVVKDLTTLADLRLGVFVDNNFGMHGIMDEARVRLALSDAAWVWADYMTVAQNTTFENYSAISSSTVVITATRGPNNTLVLSWPQGTLQSAPAATGPYTDVSTTGTTYEVQLNSATQQFFRVKVR